MRRSYEKWPSKRVSYEIIPHYCKKSDEWRCASAERNYKGKIYEEVGPLNYIMGEFTRYNEIYRYNTKDTTKWYGHEHSFDGVLLTVIHYPDSFTIEGFEEDYSEQQIKLIKAVQEKYRGKK